MSIVPSKVAAIEFALASFALPLIFWLTMYWAARWWSINWRPILPWLRTVRWISWGFAAVLLLLGLGDANFSWLGFAMLSFSAGLCIPEGWVKRRFAPELVNRDWWPSKS